MSIVAGEYMLLLLLCFSSCFTIFYFSDEDLYLYISIFRTAPRILRLNSDLLTAKNCSFYFSAIFNKDTTGILAVPISCAENIVILDRVNGYCRLHKSPVRCQQFGVPCSLYCYRFEYLSVSWFISVTFVSFSPITFLLIFRKMLKSSCLRLSQWLKSRVIHLHPAFGWNLLLAIDNYSAIKYHVP